MDDKNYISHHGILGMRWGVRRTPEQLGYSSKSKSKKISSKEKKPSIGRQKRALKRENRYYKKISKLESKYRSGLSDSDLQDRINRIENEKRLKRVTKENYNPGRKAVQDFLGSNGKKILGTIVVGASLYAAKTFVSKKFGQEAGEFISYGGPKKKK